MKTLLLILSALFFLSCSSRDKVIEEKTEIFIEVDGQIKTVQDAQETFLEKREAWEQLDIKKYRFTRTHKYYFPYDKPITMVVEDGKDVVIVDQDLLPPQLAEYPINIYFKSISELFSSINYHLYDFIENIENITEENLIKTLFLKIDYDEVYHYPKEYSIYAHYVYPYVVGGSTTVKVTEFVMLE